MYGYRNFLLLGIILAASAATSAWGQTAMPTGGPVDRGAQSGSSIPDFSGIWWHPCLPGFEPPASGPGPVTNRSRKNGVSTPEQFVGDYSNPILKPQAADVVKRYGEIELSGVPSANPANRCWPEPVPFIYKNFAMQMLQQPDKITILFEQDHEVRHVRMSQPHPAEVTPTWYGDSVAHYEGDTLVIDTVGTRTDRPFAMIDLFGTPYTKSLHVVERYRLLDYDDAKEGLERDAKENWRPPGGGGVIDRNYRGKYLQVQFTVEDEGVFTTPWTATITYGRGSNDWPEIVCAENQRSFYPGGVGVPTAEKPDF